MLFPELPEDIKSLSGEELEKLLAEHESARDLIQTDDEEFLKGLSADEIIAQLEVGVAQIKTLRSEVAAHAAAYETFVNKKAEILAELDEAPVEEEVTAKAETETEEEKVEEPVEEEKVEERELVLADAAPAPVRLSRTPPAPSAERVPVAVKSETPGTSLVASGAYRQSYPDALDPRSLTALTREACLDLGPLAKSDPRGRYTTAAHTGDRLHFSDGRVVETGRKVNVLWDGPKSKLAKAEFDFSGDRTLTGGEDDVDKIREAMPHTVTIFGQPGGFRGIKDHENALVASGGLCAPLTPIYTMPNFASEEEPVWDSLPVFRAARGGVNVPEATYIADITSAISSISEEDDALGGTFATKSCQALECPDYTETAVQILAHCREYGNLNARAWPEKIAHENALTMAALAQTSENFMLERIKALSVNVTNGAETLGALIYLVDGITKAMWGIRGRLRMSRNARFRVLLPVVIEDLMALDTISTQFDRYRSKEALVAYLRSLGVDPVFYLDGAFTAGDDQVPDAAQTAGALDGFPNEIQWAIYPEGAFLGIDSGTLELGIVRDSTLNSTNDFQVFGERFRNLTRIAPAQAAYWVTTDLCPVGSFPPAGTARTCE